MSGAIIVKPVHEYEVAIDEYHNLRKVRNPDAKWPEAAKHWGIIEKVFYPPEPSGKLREAASGYSGVVFWSSPTATMRPIIGFVSGWPGDIRIPRFVASFSWLGYMKHPLAIVKGYAAVFRALYDEAGVDASEAVVAVELPSSRIVGPVKLEVDKREKYRRIYEVGRELARFILNDIKPLLAVIDERLFMKIQEVLAERLHEEVVFREDLLEVASIDGEAALAVSLVKEFYGKLKRLAELAMEMRYAKRPSEDEILEAVRKYGIGGAVKKLGVGSSVIYSVLEKHGYKRERRRVRRLTREELEEIRRLREQGLTITEIARRLGRPVSTVYYALKRMGLAKR